MNHLIKKCKYIYVKNASFGLLLDWEVQKTSNPYSSETIPNFYFELSHSEKQWTLMKILSIIIPKIGNEPSKNTASPKNKLQQLKVLYMKTFLKNKGKDNYSTWELLIHFRKNFSMKEKTSMEVWSKRCDRHWVKEHLFSNNHFQFHFKWRIWLHPNLLPHHLFFSNRK